MLVIKTRCFPGRNYARSQSEFITLQEAANKSSSAHLGFQVALHFCGMETGRTGFWRVTRTSRLMKKELYTIVKQHSNNNTGTYISRTKAADVWDSGSADGDERER